MNITDVRINPVHCEKAEQLRAMASVTFDDKFVVTGIRIIETKDHDLFISMPSRKVGEDHKDICFPLTKAFRQQISDRVLDEYRRQQ